MRARLLLWPAVVALLVLIARWLAYALSPSPLARVLEHSAGGPSLVVVTLASLGLTVAWLGARGLAGSARRPRARAPAARTSRAEVAPAPARAARGRALPRQLARLRACSSRTCTGEPGSASTGSRASSGRCTGTRSRCWPRSRSPRPRSPRRASTCSPGCAPSFASFARRRLVAATVRLLRSVRLARAVARRGAAPFAGTAARGLTPTRERKETDEIRPGRRRRGRTHARARERRLGARDHEPARRQVEGAAAVHALGADRGGGRDHDRDRADRPRRLLDRLVRALARLEAHGERDRLRRGARDPAGDLERRQGADRRGRRSSASTAA